LSTFSYLEVKKVKSHHRVRTQSQHSIWADEIENILKGSLDSIPSPSVKIQIIGGKVCLRYKGKTLLQII